ncbi:MAG: hypothetical protein KDD43_09600, partial [Bdellovibrionales bacterium]|nr:hypothetical protein [Bdellovibrionales bacterium]
GKIPRTATTELFGLLERNIDDNEFLETLFFDLAEEGGLEFNLSTSVVRTECLGPGQQDEQWFNRLYRGELQAQDFVDLGLSGA